MGQEIANSGEMTIALEYETRIEQERRKERKSVLLLVSQENPMELVTAITTRNSPKVLTKRKGHSASIVRSGGMYLHSAQIKQKMIQHWLKLDARQMWEENPTFGMMAYCIE